MLAVLTAIPTSAQLPFAPALLDFFDVVGSVCLDGDFFSDANRLRWSSSKHAHLLVLLFSG